MHCCTAVSKAGRAEEALQETENEESGEVIDKGGGDGDDDEDEEGDGVDGTAAYDGHFGKGSEDQGTYSVGKDVEGEREGGVGGADTELFDHARFAGSVDGGAAVDGKGVHADNEGDEESLLVRPILWVGGVVGGVPVNEDGAVLCLCGSDSD